MNAGPSGSGPFFAARYGSSSLAPRRRARSRTGARPGRRASSRRRARPRRARASSARSRSSRSSAGGRGAPHRSRAARRGTCRAARPRRRDLPRAPRRPRRGRTAASARVEDLDTRERPPLEPRRELAADRLDLGQLGHEPLLDDVEQDAVRSGRFVSDLVRGEHGLGSASRRRRRARGSRRARRPSVDRVAALRAADDPDRSGRSSPPSFAVPLRARAPRCRSRARRGRVTAPVAGARTSRTIGATGRRERGRDRRPAPGSSARTLRAPSRPPSRPRRAACLRPGRSRDRRARAAARTRRARAP